MNLFIKKTDAQGGASAPPADELGGLAETARLKQTNGGARPDDGSSGLFIREPAVSSESPRPRFKPAQDISDVETYEKPSEQTTGKFSFGRALPKKAAASLDAEESPVEVSAGDQVIDVLDVTGAPVTQQTSTPPRTTLNEAFAKAKAVSPMPAEDKPVKRSIFGAVKEKLAKTRASADATSAVTAADETTAEASKHVAVGKSGRKPKASKSSIHLMVQLEASQDVCYEVTATGLHEVDIKDTTAVASFTAADFRFGVAAKTTNRGGTDLALSESVGEQVRIINMAKTFGAVYATAAERLEEYAPRVGPGALLLERILAKSETPSASHTICVLLGDKNSGITLAILYQRTADGQFSAPQVSANIADLSFTLRQFQSARGMDDESKVMQISNQELVAAAHELQLYPSDAEWYGIPITTVLSGVVMAVALGTVGVMGFAGYEHIKLGSAKADVQRAVRATAEIDKSSQDLIAQSLLSFGRINSIDMNRLSERAASIWVPRATMSVLASPSTESYSVSIPLTNGAFFNNRPSVLSEMNNVEIQQFLKITPPEGCSKNTPGVSGGVNVIQVTVSCEAGSSSISRYRLD